MEKAIEKRLSRAEWALSKAKEFAQCVKKIFDVTTSVILFGSYARGDFNEWSDIDILIVVRGDLPKKPMDRIDMVMPCIISVGAPIEPLIITREEFEKLKKKRNPAIEDAIRNGVPIP
ncbi:MAG: nucleotidyltransferase domain-containing protein [Ignisphaera sp.]|uniref:Nucleotidyltransferase domain-containing protein n=1 Tax=Ignisphaera aggregans TaxID=334771 RepID=A0A7C4JLJ0_9CREN